MEEIKQKEIIVQQSNTPYIVIIVLLFVICILSFFTWKNYDNLMSWFVAKNTEITVLFDSNCDEKKCMPTDMILENLKNIPLLQGVEKYDTIDYRSEEWTKLYSDLNLKNLPVVLFNNNNFGNSTEAIDFKKYLGEKINNFYVLDIGSKYDPNFKIPKADKPTADLYIMSYCPYWLQAQKWILEVMSKLWNVADINIKFVDYVMHDKQESDENTVQYCIQKEQKDKYNQYLNCFLWNWENEACRKEAWIDENKLSTCIASADEEFKINYNMENPTSRFPSYLVHTEDNKKYWVAWSPTFVLNWVKIEAMGRTATDYATAICDSFNQKPEECEQEFQDIAFDPMFGFTTWNWANAVNSGCGQ